MTEKSFIARESDSDTVLHTEHPKGRCFAMYGFAIPSLEAHQSDSPTANQH